MTKKMYNKNSSVLYQARYCAQVDFSIAVCMMYDIKILEDPFSLKNYGKNNQKGFKTNWSYRSKIVACESNLYKVEQDLYKVKQECTFRRYNNSRKNEIVLPSLLDQRSEFCVCSFMKKIYIIGGEYNYKNKNILQEIVNSCMCYDIKSNKWTYVGSLIKNRKHASCTVFKGRIVVTGGYLTPSRLYGNRVPYRINSTESYCFHEGMWTQFSAMLLGRADHGSVSIGNKLFVIGGDRKDSCEVLDGITNKFVFINIEYKPESLFDSNNIEAVSFDHKIYVIREEVFHRKHKTRYYMVIYSYNDEQNACSQEYNLKLECEMFSCAKISKM